MSDIRFVGEDIHIEGNVQKVTCFDIELDNAGRRKNNSGKRRAFVHDFQDGLTLNWANDYPGGVTINGKVGLGELVGTHLYVRHHDLHLDHAARRSANGGYRRALVHDLQDGLTLNWARDYPGGVTINGEVKIPHGAALNGLSGTALKCTHHTLHLDHAARRKTPPTVAAVATTAGTALSRAPVVGAASGTGVVAAGTAAELGAIASLRPSQRRALMHDTADGLTLNVAGDYPGGVTIRGTVKLPETLLVKNKDLLQLITDLQSQVAALEARVAALEPAP
jgi:hypothetical protein